RARRHAPPHVLRNDGARVAPDRQDDRRSARRDALPGSARSAPPVPTERGGTMMEALWANYRTTIIVIAAAIVAVLASLIVVPETQQAVIIRTGEPIAVINRFKPDQPYGTTGAGVWYRIPLLDRVEYIDKRVLNVDMETQQVLS